MSGSRDLAEHYADVLAPVAPLEIRRFFGGFGLHARGHLVAIVMSQLYFRVSPELGAELLRDGGAPFRYRSSGKQVTVPRFVGPPSRMADGDALRALAQRVLNELVERSRTRPR